MHRMTIQHHIRTSISHTLPLNSTRFTMRLICRHSWSCLSFDTRLSELLSFYRAWVSAEEFPRDVYLQPLGRILMPMTPAPPPVTSTGRWMIILLAHMVIFDLPFFLPCLLLYVLVPSFFVTSRRICLR